MAAQLSPLFNDAQFDGNGNLLNAGLIWWYIAGTSTPQNTFSDNNGLVANPNPIVLNARGEPSDIIRLGSGLTYKAVLETAPVSPLAHGSVIRTVDYITGVGDIQLSIVDGGTYT